MNTGSLRTRVTLDVPSGTTGGFLPLNPADWDCVFLNEAAGMATLIGRFHPGITTATRVHVKGRIYHVNTLVNREERDVELILTCHQVFD